MTALSARFGGGFGPPPSPNLDALPDDLVPHGSCPVCGAAFVEWVAIGGGGFYCVLQCASGDSVMHAKPPWSPAVSELDASFQEREASPDTRILVTRVSPRSWLGRRSAGVLGELRAPSLRLSEAAGKEFVNVFGGGTYVLTDASGSTIRLVVPGLRPRLLPCDLQPAELARPP